MSDRKETFRRIRLLATSISGMAAAYEAGCDPHEDPEALASACVLAIIGPFADLGSLVMPLSKELKHIQFVDGKAERIQ